MIEPDQYKIQVVPSFKDINGEDWDRLIAGQNASEVSTDELRKNPTVADNSEEIKNSCPTSNQSTSSQVSPDLAPNPFVTHAFLSSLEDSGSAILDTGWLGQHLLLQDENDNIVGALACYLKNHSQGEYIFDHGWADAFERAGGRYYPKLQCSIPFTPVTGPRFLVGSSENRDQYRAILASGLKQLCARHQVSSAHVTFMPQDDWQAMEDHDFLLRMDQQFHWQNQNFENFQQFLDTLASRRERIFARSAKRHKPLIILSSNGF